MGKTVEEQFLLNKIEECEENQYKYLEADMNKLAGKWNDKMHLYQNIYNLVQDGYKYRDLCK
jgi:hypothetical protein